MATFYWVGGETAAGLARYDFNTAANWNNKYWEPNTTGSSNGWKFVGATNAPGHGSIVHVGYSSPYEPIDPPTCKAPLLFGGFSGNVGYGEWANALGSTGTTLTSSLLQFVSGSWNGSGIIANYPFPYLGGGMTAAVYDWAITNQGVSADAFNSAIGARAVLPLKLKVSNWMKLATGATSQPKYVDVRGVKSLTTLPGFTAQYVTTMVECGGAGGFVLQGGSYKQLAYGGFTPTSSLYLSGLNVGSFIANPSPMFVDSSNKFNNLSMGGQFMGDVWFGGSFDTATVLADLGITGSSLETDGTCSISPTCTSHLGYYPNVGIPTIHFGLPTFESSSQVSIKRLLVSSANCPQQRDEPPYDYIMGTGPAEENVKWNVVFEAGVSANYVELVNSDIYASPSINANATVNIGTMDMADYAVLDYTRTPQFNNWSFGSITGGQINGGIVFQDETAKVLGSAGVRLFNTYLLGGRVDGRTGKPAGTNSGLPAALD